MAKYLLDHYVAEACKEPWKIQAWSAGASALEGMRASEETQRLLRAMGIDTSAHRAQRLTDEMIREADHIFVMEEFHREIICSRVPDACSNVHLLKTFQAPRPVPPSQAGIVDPIGKPLEVYEICFATIKEAIERVGHWLLEEL